MRKLGMAITLTALGVLGAGCDRAGASTAGKDSGAIVPAAPAVQVTKPLPRLEHAATAASGQIRSLHEATLGAKVSGTIGHVRVEVGDRVAAGRPLVELDDTAAAANVLLAKAAVDAARSDVRLAALELDRQKQLLAGNAAPQAQLDRAQANHDSAVAQLSRAEANLTIARHTLADHVVRAPFGGVITERLVQAGESVTAAPATALVSLVDDANLEVRLDVPESAADGLRTGMAVRATVSPSGAPLDAKVKAIGAAVDPKSRTVEVLLAIPAGKAGPRPGVRPGALVTVQLASPAALAGPFVPAKAVQTQGGASFVWVVKDGVAHRREIRGELQGTDLFRVASGLSGSEAVVTAGADRLRDGIAVRAVD